MIPTILLTTSSRRVPCLQTGMGRMAILFTALCTLTSALMVASSAQAQVQARIPPPTLEARAYILVDFDSGAVLAEKNADEREEPASLTKMMTIYVAGHALESGHIKMSDKVSVSRKAWKMEGSRMFIEVGKSIPLDQILDGIIVQSGNDASVALAEHIDGSEDVFASEMTQRAHQLGMSNSSFANATGLPNPNTYTTARDMSKLATALIREFPDLYKRFSIKEFEYAGIHQLNRNRLLTRDSSVDGIKTGHTQSAGYCLVASALRNGMRLISVVMGTSSDAARTEASQALLDYGFRFFETRKLYDADKTIATPRVWKGTVDKVGVHSDQPVYITIPRGRYGDLHITAKLNEPVIAPVEKESTLGHVTVSLDGKAIREVPLKAMRRVEAGSIFSRLYDGVLLWFQ